MTNDNTYNGWTNYATWRVYCELFDGADSSYTADSAREYAEEIIEESSSGLAQDYAMSFLSEVDWREIAEHCTEEEEIE